MKDYIDKFISYVTVAILLTLNALGYHNIGETWLIPDIPAYGGGVYTDTVYNTGTFQEKDFENAGTNYSLMQGVHDTDHNEILLNHIRYYFKGYKQIFYNKIGKIEYRCYRNEKTGIQFYTMYNTSDNSLKIMDDSSSYPLDSFGYSCEPNGTTTVYQYNFSYFNYDDCNNGDIYANNGMMYIVKLADNKLMVIDGGATKQWANANVKKLLSFMHEITGTKPGEQIHIALWYGTHPHSDHVSVLYKLLFMNQKEFVVERAMFNFGAYDTLPYDQRADTFRGFLNNYHPDAKYVKCRAGYTCNIADVKLEVLMTHESLVDFSAEKLFPSAKVNDMTSVLKLTIAGKTFLFLGDMDKPLEKAIINLVPQDVLHADVVQAAHHLFNNLTYIYKTVQPEYAFAPQSMHHSVNSLPAYNTLTKYVSAGNVMFEDQGTYGMRPSGDGFEISFRPYDSSPYDNTKVSGNKN